MATPNRTRRGPRLDFEVTAAQIATAVPRDSGHCMIADALAEAYPTAQNISVDLATIRFTDPAAGWRYIYLTPTAAQLALIEFDRGEVRPEPFTVRARAAQMVPTGTARKARRAEAIRQGKTRTPRSPAVLYYPDGNKGGAVPVKLGGQAPPMSELATGRGSGKSKGAWKGRRREFGLRALIR